MQLKLNFCWGHCPILLPSSTLTTDLKDKPSLEVSRTLRFSFSQVKKHASDLYIKDVMLLLRESFRDFRKVGVNSMKNDM